MFGTRILAIVALMAASSLCIIFAEIRTRETGNPVAYSFAALRLELERGDRAE